MNKEEWLGRIFRNYYMKNAERVREPEMLEHREFGFVYFNRKGMERHLSFPDRESLIDFIRSRYPKHAYYSTAYYISPGAPTMDEKQWIGAELVFDIDADHIETSCKNVHDYWRCTKCGREDRGPVPNRCPNCGSDKLNSITWVCHECIDAAREECEKVVDMLINDLGFHQKDLEIFFSGHRGFHIHLYDKRVYDIPQEGRREIVSYLRGEGLDIALLIERTLGSSIRPLDLDSKCWGGRIARGMYEIILTSTEENLKRLGITASVRKYILLNRSKILENMENANWEFLREIIRRRGGKKSIAKIIEHVVNMYAAEVDERVTIDTRRLIRLPGTLHGKTGLAVVNVDIDGLWTFNPFEDAIVLSDETIEVEIVGSIPERVWGIKLGKASRLKVPLYLAIYLVNNNVAELCRR
ncbi:MAG: hypothetical protein DRN53_01095 [Thermoprotei archaeon]|nr:MAG: hypothetical protein DRN53_01095 [Thermoprotei archaeon]